MTPIPELSETLHCLLTSRADELAKKQALSNGCDKSPEPGSRKRWCSEDGHKPKRRATKGIIRRYRQAYG